MSFSTEISSTSASNREQMGDQEITEIKGKIIENDIESKRRESRGDDSGRYDDFLTLSTQLFEDNSDDDVNYDDLSLHEFLIELERILQLNENDYKMTANISDNLMYLFEGTNKENVCNVNEDMLENLEDLDDLYDLDDLNSSNIHEMMEVCDEDYKMIAALSENLMFLFETAGKCSDLEDRRNNIQLCAPQEHTYLDQYLEIVALENSSRTIETVCSYQLRNKSSSFRTRIPKNQVMPVSESTSRGTKKVESVNSTLIAGITTALRKIVSSSFLTRKKSKKIAPI